MRSALNVCVAMTVGVLTALTGTVADADSILLSTKNSARLGGLFFENGDLVKYNPATNSATLFFDEDLFSNGENIDAVTVLANGNIVLSTTSRATLGGLTFKDGDLAEYNPATNSATLLFDEDLFSNGEDVRAFGVTSNGNIILTTQNGARLGGIRFDQDELVEYNPATNTATLLFDESLFTRNEAIDAVHRLNNGNLVLSTTGRATLGGLTFEDGDLVEYNPATDVASIYFNEDLFIWNEDIDAVYIEEEIAHAPLPLAAWMSLPLLAGLGVTEVRRRRRAVA